MPFTQADLVPFTQADLDALDQAISRRARGEQVEDVAMSDGRRIRYAAMNEAAVDRLRARMVDEIQQAAFAAAGVRRVRGFRGSMGSGY